MRIAVVTPSRGLVHSRMVESVLENLNDLSHYQEIEWKYFFTNDLPIPDAQNNLIERALHWGPDYIWSVEEDNLIPQGGLRLMFSKLEKDGDVVCIDYPIGEKRSSGVCKKGDKILWCAMGCTLFGSWVFERLEKPWFSVDKTWRITNKNPLELVEENIPNKYGGQDIYFGMRLNEKGMKIDVIPDLVGGHIKPIKLGNAGLNDGAHKFEVWDKIEEYQNYK